MLIQSTGVTAIRPDDIDLPCTATDLCRDTWMLSGSSVMINGKTIKNNYICDLDTVTSGTKLGVMRSADKSLEFYKDGVPQGVACHVPHSNIYAVIDLYGQCAQVSIPYGLPLAGVTAPGMLWRLIRRKWHDTFLLNFFWKWKLAILKHIYYNFKVCSGFSHIFLQPT